MLSAQSYSFQQNTRLAISLSWIGGFTNVVALIACGHFVSHMTGNTTSLGMSLVARHWHESKHFAFLIGMFLAGATLSALITESTRRRGVLSNYILPMAVQALLLGILGFGLQRYPDLEHVRRAILWSITGVAALAMGLQNATITKISGAVVRTTHVTGVLTDLGLESMQLLLWYHDKLRGQSLTRAGRVWRVSQRHPTFLRVLLLASIFGSFLFGAGAGAWAYDRWHAQALAAPIVFLLWIIFMDWIRPIAAVQEIDVLSDPEFKLAGILKSMLPAELGIYRLFHHRNHATHRAPNFVAWVDLLPSHWRVIILALSPMTRLDDNAIFDLLQAVRKLRANGRLLIIAGVTTKQYRLLEARGAVEELEFENLCPDLEFAIARGMDILQQVRGEK